MGLPEPAPASGPVIEHACLVLVQAVDLAPLRERVPAALRRSEDLLRETAASRAIAHGGGVVVSTAEGVLARFSGMVAAARFAVQLQEDLLGVDWPATLLMRPEACEIKDDDLVLFRGLRVRVGVHRGRVEAHEDGSVAGPAVYQVARLVKVTKGGQVVLSEPAWRHLGGGLPGNVVLRDLGEHALTGVDGRSRLFQVLPRQLDRRAFEPLDTEDHLRTNVSPVDGRFLGREGDLSALRELARFGVRLISIIGDRGMGKSHLVRQFAWQEREPYAGEGGVWLAVPSERTLHGLLHAVSEGLDVPLAHSSTDGDAVQRIGHALAARGRLLLVIDRLDPDGEGVRAALETWLRTAPETRLLVNAGQRIGLPGEVAYRVLPLPLPTKDRPRDAVAVTLYATAARQVDRKFDLDQPAVIAGISNELGGNPLAIRLLAGIADRLSPQEQLDRLLSGDLGPGGVLQEVWEHLDDDERRVLTACAQYPGAFELGGAEALMDEIGEGELSDPLEQVLERCVRRGLLRVAPDLGAPQVRRFALDPRVRSWALSLLDPELAHALQARFAQRVLSVCDPWPTRANGRDRPEVVARLAVEWPNLVEVLRYGLDPATTSSQVVDTALRALLMLEPLFEARGPLSMQLALHQQALERSDKVLGNDPLLQVRVLVARADALRRAERGAQALQHLERAKSIAERWADRAGVARALLAQGRCLADTGAVEGALPLLEQAMTAFHEVGKDLGAAAAAEALGAVHLAMGHHDDAEAMLHTAVSTYRSQDARHLEARSLVALALLYRRTSRPDEARSLYRETIRALRSTGARWLAANVRTELALLDYHLGRLKSAEEGLVEAVQLARRVGHRQAEGQAMANLALLALDADQREKARHLLLQTLAIHRDLQDALGEAVATGYLGLLLHLSDHRAGARDYYRRAVDQLSELSERRLEALFTGWLAALEAESLEPATARAVYDVALTRHAETGDPPVGEALTQLRSVLDLMEAEIAQRAGDAAAAARWRNEARRRWDEAMERYAQLHGEARFVVRRVQRLLESGLPARTGDEE